MFSGPPTVQPGVVRVNWTAADSSDPLVTGIRYALYSQCGAQTTFQLIDDDIQGLSYNITTLPTLTQCVLRVVVYSDHCLLDVNSPLKDTTGSFMAGNLVRITTFCILVFHSIRINVLSFFLASFIQCVQSMSMLGRQQKYVNLVQHVAPHLVV